MRKFPLHTYITAADVAFGVALGIIIESLLDFVGEIPSLAGLRYFPVLSTESVLLIALLLYVSVITNVLLKWLVYRDTMVRGLSDRSTAWILRGFIEERRDFLTLYLLVEMLIVISPAIYLSLASSLMSETPIDPMLSTGVSSWVMLGSLFPGLALTFNYACDLIVTNPDPKKGIYSGLSEKIRIIEKLRDSDREVIKIRKSLDALYREPLTRINSIMFPLSLLAWAIPLSCIITASLQGASPGCLALALVWVGIMFIVVLSIDSAALFAVLRRIRPLWSGEPLGGGTAEPPTLSTASP